MLVYDWMWWGQLTNQNLAQRCAEVRGGALRYARRYVWRCVEVCRGMCGGAWRCAEVHGGAWRCAEVCGGGGEKNQDFMLIRFLNAGI